MNFWTLTSCFFAGIVIWALTLLCAWGLTVLEIKLTQGKKNKPKKEKKINKAWETTKLVVGLTITIFCLVGLTIILGWLGLDLVGLI